MTQNETRDEAREHARHLAYIRYERFICTRQMIDELLEAGERAGLERAAQRLRNHWLSNVECLHVIRSDVSHCACGWKSNTQPTVGEAVAKWAEHALELDSALAAEGGGE